MNFSTQLKDSPSEVRKLIAAFLVVLNVGFYTGLPFVGQTDSATPNGMVENYNGNEEVENAPVMKFKKSQREMLTIVHTHILSMSFIFFFMGGLLSMTSLSKKWKQLLMIEPFVSVLVTFGGIYLVWYGIEWFSYVVVLSGTLMTATFVIGTFLIFRELYLCKNP